MTTYRSLTESMQNRIKNVRLDMFRSQQKVGLIFTMGLTVLVGAQVSAQESGQIDEIIVTGARTTIQDAIAMKRNATQIVDGLSADDIGDIPALSIGEALETITGATSHRENGGASEISVRGLGPFLGTSVINGREATNGGGNRAVNFSIFPSEMFNSVAIHKTQSAEYIEGAVSGQIHLDTRRPLDYGRQLLQINVKAAAGLDESGINGGQDYGSRGTVAYIDSWDFENGSALGVSLGVQVRDETNPEQEYLATSGGGRLEACRLESFDVNALPVDTVGRCHDSNYDPLTNSGANVDNTQIQAIIDDPDNGINSVGQIPFAYISRDHRYRQNTSDDEREAVFGSVQFRPNDRLDIYFDFQSSERDQTELRKDLQFGTTQEDISALTSDPTTGVLYSSTSETNIYSYTTDFQRLEKYEGFGLNVDFQVTENINLSLDYANSDTLRTETDVELRLGATDNNLAGGSGDDFTVQLDLNQGPGTAIATILDDGGNGFEITDPSYFNAYNRARIRARELSRENSLDAFRADLTISNEGPIHTLKTGFRSSTQEYLTFGGLRNAVGESLFEDEDLVTPNGGADDAVTDAILANVLACADQSFPESDFLSNVRDGELINNAVSGSSVSAFATFDYECAADAWLANYGGLDGIQYQNGISSGSNNVTEETLAFYLQADFETEWADYPIRGNFGARLIDTDITSVGYRGPITVEQTDDGFFVSEGDPGVDGFETDTQRSGYSEVLPSLTVIVDLEDDLVLRAGVFRGMSRPDPNAYGNGRSINEREDGSGADDGFATLSEAVNGITATGNPYLRPILSDNFDLGLEWYPNEDTILGVAAYWKEFNGAFENVSQLESFNLDGNVVQGFVEAVQISDDTSTLTGVEFTATHSFNYLPGFLSGFGGKFSLNMAASDYEFEDQYGGDGTLVEADPVTGEITETALVGILPPAGLFGLSKYVSSTQLYWEKDDFYMQAIYKTRSQYFQAYTRDNQGRLRYTGDNQTLDLRARYRVSDNLKVSIDVTNILDEPRIDYRGAEGNVLQTLTYGPRVFLGATYSF